MMFMMGWWVLLWGVIVVGVVWLARGSFDTRGKGQTETPIETLNRRFAEGAISVDDYYERLAVINSNADSAGPVQDHSSL